MRCWLAFSVVLLAVAPVVAAEKANPLGKQIDGFSLQDFRGKPVQLADMADSKCVVVAFLGVECPLAKLYAPRLEALAQEYRAQGVSIVGIDSNRQDNVTELAHYARVHGVTFPLLKDSGNAVADQFGAERTPQVFLLDSSRTVRYVGRIDDQYGVGSASGYAKTDIRKAYLKEAIDALLSGQSIDIASTDANGCLIGRMHEPNEQSEVTYGNQISRVLQKHCVECHRPGQIAPLALTTYEEVAGWAEMIEEVVRDQRMPPWHADPKHGSFLNDRSMTQEEKDQIYAWVRNGAPAGDLGNVPEPIKYPEGWQIGTPDEVYYIDDEPYLVKAEGEVEYQYFMIDPGWKEDRWLASSECLIDNRAVVHHIFVFAVPPDSPVPTWKGAKGQSEGVSGGQGGGRLIAGAAPGTAPMDYPVNGMAAFCPAGTRLLFQMHYTPNGSPQPDRTAVGFRFIDAKDVTHNAKMNLTINTGFKIPAGADEHPVEATKEFDQDTLILTMAPHMHVRGKSFYYELRYPDGTTEVLLNVPKYDFNWQTIYALAKPKFVPAGSVLYTKAHFDNSDRNMANPDPTSDVKWGDQTWEEMMIGWFADTTDIYPEDVPPGMLRGERFARAAATEPPKMSKLIERAAAKAVKSPRHMELLARQMAKSASMVDRMCVSYVDGEQVKFLNVEQSAVLQYPLGDKDQTYAVADSALAGYAAGGAVVANADLTKADKADLKRMSAAAKSSLHVPIQIDGKPATVNFWSKEPAAFGEAATALLTQVAQRMGGAE